MRFVCGCPRRILKFERICNWYDVRDGHVDGVTPDVLVSGQPDRGTSEHGRCYGVVSYVGLNPRVRWSSDGRPYYAASPNRSVARARLACRGGLGSGSHTIPLHPFFVRVKVRTAHRPGCESVQDRCSRLAFADQRRELRLPPTNTPPGYKFTKMELKAGMPSNPHLTPVARRGEQATTTSKPSVRPSGPSLHRPREPKRSVGQSFSC
jgi:hypothetical protein